MATVWGLTYRQVQRLSLEAPARGVRTSHTLATVQERCAAVALILECFAFSHLTAALLHGLPLPRALVDDAGMHVMRDARDGAVRRAGVVGHRGLHQREVTTVCGLPTIGMADTWVDLGELIHVGSPLGLDDLIVIGDAVATRLGSVEPLRLALERRERPRGKLTLVEALEEIRVGSESPGETRSRLILVRAGLPEPELNQPLFSLDGVWLGRPDMMWRSARVLLEYQGREFHDSDHQRRQDAVRFAGFEADGWKVIPVWNDDVNTDEARVALVRSAADLLGHAPDLLRLDECHPRFFSKRMLELAEKRARRLRAQAC
ncbi:hypothetical protein IDVR_31960 [Intrasporangium sp. DVR]